MWRPWTRVFALCGALMASQAQPVFPDGVQSIMSSVAGRQQQYVHRDEDETAKLRELEDTALGQMEEYLSEESAMSQLREARAPLE